LKTKNKFVCATIIFLLGFGLYIYDASCITKEDYKELVKNHPYQERLKLTKTERKKLGIPPNKYFDEQYLLEMNPKTGKTNPENLLKYKRSKKRSPFLSLAPGQNTQNRWEERGPNNIGGRTRVVFYDPNDATKKRVFAGGVSGGLWVNNNITDVNSMWYQVGIDENLSISCYTIDPNDSNIWYVGTGESYTQDDGVGNGIWKTTNGGATWFPYLSVNLDLDTAVRPYFINQIVAWNKNGTTELFFSVDGQFDIDPVGQESSGWWTEKEDAFKKISFLTPQGKPYVFSDVEIAIDNSLWIATKPNLYGNGGGKLFRTTDGVNFTQKYSFTNGERVELSVSKQNKNTVFALASINDSEGVTLVKTIDGVNFSSLAKPNDVGADVPPNDFARSQGFYNLTLQVDPNNDDILYAGGINLFRSNNAGATWNQISKWTDNFGLESLNVSTIHPDQHAVVLNGTNSDIGLIANDGGIYYSGNLSTASNSTNAIEARNFGYNITQFYSGAIGQDINNELLLGGSQDNGALFGVTLQGSASYSPSASPGINFFVDVFGGDGIESFIDKEGEYMIVSFVNNVYGLHKLPLNTENNLIDISNDQNSGSFENTADLDDDLDILYTDGTTLGGLPRISRYTNLISSPTRKNFTNSMLHENPTAIKVSPYTLNSSTVLIGTEGASVLKVTNFNTNNPTWTNIDLDNKINIGSISDIDFGRNENEILVTLHNYGVNNIYYTQNGGATWQEKEGNFPDIPVKAIKMNPNNFKEVIIGTNMGVWRTGNFDDNNPNWLQSQNGMSNVKVTKFDIRTSDNMVLASTYGRGLFTAPFVNEKMFISIKEIGDENIIFDDTFITNGVLKLRLNTKIKKELKAINIYNIKGDLVERIRSNHQDEYFIKMPYISGVYIVTVVLEQGTYSKKIIVNN